jgi:tripartite-type tricarboxylate transporter receptor subunit TctC
VVVENRGGAGGNIAAKTVFTAAPDGYTLLATTTGLAVNMTAPRTAASSRDDIRPVAIVAISPTWIAQSTRAIGQGPRRSSSPTPRPKLHLRQRRRSAPARRSARSNFFKEVAKVNYVHVPFQGGAPAITATLGNHVDSLVLTLPPVTPHNPSGGSCAARRGQRQAQFGDPGRADLRRDGFPNVYSQSWVGFFARPRRPTPSCKSSTPRSTR